MDIIWFIVVWFVFVAYLMVLFRIMGDLFRDPRPAAWRRRCG